MINVDSLSMPQSSSGLNTQAISCTRGYRELFQNLSFSLQAGQVLRIEGENGSGKTSLLRILAGLAMPADGDVMWNNLAVRHAENDYFNHMFYLGHKASIKFELSARENLCMHRELYGHESQANIDKALEKIGLYGFEDIVCANLSAGQKRRVALAQLLLTRAQLWILDEPYTSLDVDAVKMLEDIFAQHVKNGGMMVITSHQPVSIEGSDYRRLCLPATEIEVMS